MTIVPKQAVRVAIRLSSEQHDQLAALAARHHATVSACIRAGMGLLRTFGEGCPKAFVIQVVMPLGHLVAIAPTTFFQFNTLG